MVKIDQVNTAENTRKRNRRDLWRMAIYCGELDKSLYSL